MRFVCCKLITVVFLFVQCQNPGINKSFIRNKAAQLFSLAFVVDFPLRWPSFVRDLLSYLQAGEAAVDIYVRILMAIDSEVVDREIAHTPEVCTTKAIHCYGMDALRKPDSSYLN